MVAKVKQGKKKKKERKKIIKDSEKEFFKNKQGKITNSQILVPLAADSSKNLTSKNFKRQYFE